MCCLQKYATLEVNTQVDALTQAQQLTMQN